MSPRRAKNLHNLCIYSLSDREPRNKSVQFISIIYITYFETSNSCPYTRQAPLNVSRISLSSSPCELIDHTVVRFWKFQPHWNVTLCSCLAAFHSKDHKDIALKLFIRSFVHILAATCAIHSWECTSSASLRYSKEILCG